MKRLSFFLALGLCSSSAFAGGEVSFFSGFASPIGGDGRLTKPEFSIWFNPADIGSYLGVVRAPEQTTIQEIEARNTNYGGTLLQSNPGLQQYGVQGNRILIHSQSLYDVRKVGSLFDAIPEESAKKEFGPPTSPEDAFTKARLNGESVILTKKDPVTDRVIEKFSNLHGKPEVENQIVAQPLLESVPRVAEEGFDVQAVFYDR